MRTGEVEANLVRLNEPTKLLYIPELIERKVGGSEKGTLDQADLSFYQQDYEWLLAVLEQAHEESNLPEVPSAANALNSLLVRLRLKER